MNHCPILCRLAPAALCALLSSCGDDAERVHDAVRQVDAAEVASYPIVRDTAARLRVPANTTSSTASPAQEKPQWVYELPPGWTGRATDNDLRALDFRVPAVPEIQCYMSLTRGPGSTLAANINRWAAQAQKPALTDEQIRALETRPFLRQPVPFVAFEGPIQDRMSGVSIDDAALLGLVRVTPGGALTLKFVGPREEVRARETEFLALAASIDLAPDENHGENQGGSAPRTPLFQNGGRRIAGDPPAEWQREQRQMRLMSFKVGANCECSVSAFNGGVRDNINRWRRQIGLEFLDDAAVAQLPRLPMVGAQGTMAVMQGHFRDGMSGTDIEDAVLFGVVCPLQGETLFVKMWGPRAEMEPRQQEFEAFVRSLREEGN